MQEISVQPKKKASVLDSIANVINTGVGVLGAANTVSGIVDKFDTAKQFAAQAGNVVPEKLPAAEMAPMGSPVDAGAAMLRRAKRLTPFERTV